MTFDKRMALTVVSWSALLASVVDELFLALFVFRVFYPFFSAETIDFSDNPLLLKSLSDKARNSWDCSLQ